ncbi:MAG TPA: hypothetical protein VLJ37_12365 [bacterium]|nr:hypothetical protein [bacterium]
MNALFTGGNASLSGFVSCFGFNPLGFPRVPFGSPQSGWRSATLTSENQQAFVSGIRPVLEEARRFLGDSGDKPIPDTLWRMRWDGDDRFRLSRPRYSLFFDLSEDPWTDLVEFRKEYWPDGGGRRLISQKMRRTRNEAEPLREIKEMVFSHAEMWREFGRDSRAVGLFEHQLMMLFQVPNFERLRVVSGQALVLNSREPLMTRWNPNLSRSPAPKGAVDQEAPTPAQGVSAIDPDYPYRVYYEKGADQGLFRLYLSRREPGNAALTMGLGLKILWDRIETFVETTDRAYPGAALRRL